MNDLPLFIAIIVISSLLVLALIFNIIFKLISIIKERKINEENKSNEIRTNRSDDNNNTGKSCETKNVSNESIKEIEENYKVDEK